MNYSSIYYIKRQEEFNKVKNEYSKMLSDSTEKLE